MQPSFLIEQNFKNLIVLGFDEAGRGPLAGPVVAGCAMIDNNNFIVGINDSKKLSKIQRKKIFNEIKQKIRYGVGIVDEKIVDEINILQATKLAMQKAYVDFSNKYKISPQIALIDGNFNPFDKNSLKNLEKKCYENTICLDNIIDSISIIKGDQKSISIACASIIAKEIRDEIMLEFHNQFPQYGFDKHSGYATKIHLEMIEKFGISPIHRKTFAPMKKQYQFSF